MQVRLEPVGPSGRGARISRRLAVLAPVGILSVIVLSAVAARAPAAVDRSDPPATITASQAQPSGAAGGATAEPSGSTAAPMSPPSVPAVDRSVPKYAWNLPVKGLPALLADRAAGRVRGGLVAVVGVLAYDPRTARCPAALAGLAIVFCERNATLVAASASDPDVDASRPIVSPSGSPDAAQALTIQPVLPPGIPMPAMFVADPPPNAPGEPLLSVVIGRFARPDPPRCAAPVSCDAFVIERLAWAAGSWVDRILVRDPSLPESAIPSVGRRPQAIASREADRVEQILSLAILQPDRLQVIDPAAGQAAARGAQAAALAAGPVWYLRSAGREQTSLGRALTWAVIDHESGFVLATGAVEPS
jgi:hypothetical protein